MSGAQSTSGAGLSEPQPDSSAIAQQIPLRDGRLRFWPCAVPPAVADGWFRQLNAELAWHQEQLHLYGRWVAVPREVAWHGDANASYRYSGKTHDPEPWTPALGDICEWVSRLTGHRFNSVLGNRYRDGRDAMGWHADREPELGPEPAIASVSLGATRRMRFRRTDNPGETFHLDLPGGSVLAMDGPMQQFWQHSITRTTRTVGQRVNLTFRQIVNTAS